ncbi:MAG: Lrp/AsnC family transcriptional regulator [Eggerthellaceae bacterium]|nr:Lrp/AsnC family transcriptional regulator [Eggerthellaceae bacterium]
MLADDSGNHPTPETEEILLSILQTDKPLSIREIAGLMGKTVPSTRYHVSKQVDVGLAVPTASSTSRNRKYLSKQEASL